GWRSCQREKRAAAERSCCSSSRASMSVEEVAGEAAGLTSRAKKAPSVRAGARCWKADGCFSSLAHSGRGRVRCSFPDTASGSKPVACQGDGSGAMNAPHVSGMNDESSSWDRGPLDSRQLRAFVSLARTGSFTATGRELFLSQSAISHSMRALEEDVGCRL